MQRWILRETRNTLLFLSKIERRITYFPLKREIGSLAAGRCYAMASTFNPSLFLLDLCQDIKQILHACDEDYAIEIIIGISRIGKSNSPCHAFVADSWVCWNGTQAKKQPLVGHRRFSLNLIGLDPNRTEHGGCQPSIVENGPCSLWWCALDG